METADGWSETDSRAFIEAGRIVIPHRDEIGETILDLLPADRDEPFVAVDIGQGAGWLSATIVSHFPRARLVGLDGSEVMLDAARRELQRFAGRFELRQFRLEDSAWLATIPHGVRCFVSSLVIHHLSGDGKRTLYGELYKLLAPGGAVLIADLIAPSSERERRHMARSWDEAVRNQSLALTGSLDTFQQFLDTEWNVYEYPDPMDMPSTVPEHLQWLTEAGFEAVNVFWERAGHAVYGGYK